MEYEFVSPKITMLNPQSYILLGQLGGCWFFRVEVSH